MTLIKQKWKIKHHQTKHPYAKIKLKSKEASLKLILFIYTIYNRTWHTE